MSAAAQVADPLGVLAETAPHASSLGLYVHVPFCAKRCHFCSFTTAPFSRLDMERYLGALHREIELVASAPWAGAVTLATVFLGGGTPSLLEPAELHAMLAELRRRFAVSAGAEITVECTPESVSRSRLERYREAGVTRISLGVESLDDAILARLGRQHRAHDARIAFATAREAQIPQVSVDIMYGLPDLGLEGWTRGVHHVLDWEPDHLSAYALTLDEGSVWASTGVSGLPDEATVIAQYWALAEAAAARSYEHYEISNYARRGSRSRHNQLYWQHREYLALGPGACGFVGRLRYGNTRSTRRYGDWLEQGRLPIDQHEWLSDRQRTGDRLMLGLRTADGVRADWLSARATGDARVETRLTAWQERGLLQVAGGRARLTEAGFLVSDALIVELL